MAPGSSQKGTGKKNAAAVPKSRNSTPAPAISSLPPQEFYDPDYLNTRVILFPNLSYEDLVDQGASNATVPDSRTVDAMLDKLKSLVNIMEKRSTFYDRGMRYLADERKKRPEDFDHMRVDNEQEGRKSKHKKKKGSDSLAAPDGSTEKSSPARDSRSKHGRGGSGSASPGARGSPSAMDDDDKSKKKDDNDDDDESESSSEDEGAPPKREMPQAMTFGEDPSTFPDPTVYEILPVTDDMTEEEKKEIYSVGVYPKSDLADLIAGIADDKDYSNAKPSNQINFTTFCTYVDPYFRPYGEEDLAFLRERGDRATPFVMPKRGKRHYTEVWAEDDGAMSVDSPQQGRDKLPPHIPRGSIENMSDSVAETDALSIGPLASRLLAALRPENRQQDDKATTNGTTNGDVSMNGDDDDQPNGTADDKDKEKEKSNPLPPATYMKDSSTDAWKKAAHPKLEYANVT